MEQTTSSSRSWVSKAIVLVLVIAAGGLAFLFGKKAEESELVEEPGELGSAVGTETPSDDAPAVVPSATAPATAPTTAPTTAPATAPSTEPAVTTTYKDGVYSAIGNYSAPSGAESIDVTLTVTNDVITGATVSATATNPASKQWQEAFISGYKSSVVGKKLADLKLSKVSGASLTTKGFTDALNEIRTQAKS